MCNRSKYVELIAMKNQEAITIALAFIDYVILRYGAPKSLLSDRGQNFLSKLIEDVCTALEIKRLRCSSYHPACNGQNERSHSTILNLLVTIIGKNFHLWDEALPIVRFLYNTSKHS